MNEELAAAVERGEATIMQQAYLDGRAPRTGANAGAVPGLPGDYRGLAAGRGRARTATCPECGHALTFRRDTGHAGT